MVDSFLTEGVHEIYHITHIKNDDTPILAYFRHYYGSLQHRAVWKPHDSGRVALAILRNVSQGSTIEHLR